MRMDGGSGSWRKPLRRARVPAVLALFALGAAVASPLVHEPPPLPPSGLALLLNIPAYRLDVLRDDVIVRSFAVAVGMPRYPTPTGDFTIGRIVWNPWWHPPDREWARDEQVTPPGPTNPMGRVKLLMERAYYLHGTPYRSSIGTAGSHGCIRMLDESAIALARLVQDATGAPIGDATVDSLTTRTRRTRTVTLPERVPLRIVYEVVELRGDTLLLHRDVYRRGTVVTRDGALAALATIGVDSSRLDLALLDSLVAMGRTGHVVAVVSHLLR